MSSAAHALCGGRVHGGAAGVGSLGVEFPPEVWVESACLELLVLLAERAGLAAEVDAAVAAGVLGEAELGAQLGAVGAGVDPLAPREVGQQRVQRPARPARRRAAVHDLGDATERDARAPARQAAEAAVVEAVEETRGPLARRRSAGDAADGEAGHRLRRRIAGLGRIHSLDRRPPGGGWRASGKYRALEQLPCVCSESSRAWWRSLPGCSYITRGAGPGQSANGPSGVRVPGRPDPIRVAR
jgi:hypothetical protein